MSSNGTFQFFFILQGVRQGGILNADLYKLYINQLLNRLAISGQGASIGYTVCNSHTCADDLSSLRNSTSGLQFLCNIAFDYSRMERYQLQPTKSVVIPVKVRRKSADREKVWKLGEDNMPIVD